MLGGLGCCICTEGRMVWKVLTRMGIGYRIGMYVCSYVCKSMCVCVCVAHHSLVVMFSL